MEIVRFFAGAKVAAGWCAPVPKHWNWKMPG
jgi:hypothetical protein